MNFPICFMDREKSSRVSAIGMTREKLFVLHEKNDCCSSIKNLIKFSCRWIGPTRFALDFIQKRWEALKGRIGPVQALSHTPKQPSFQGKTPKV
jgi:hypothetical protein